MLGILLIWGGGIHRHQNYHEPCFAAGFGLISGSMLGGLIAGGVIGYLYPGFWLSDRLHTVKSNSKGLPFAVDLLAAVCRCRTGMTVQFPG